MSSRALTFPDDDDAPVAASAASAKIQSEYSEPELIIGLNHLLLIRSHFTYIPSYLAACLSPLSSGTSPRSSSTR